MSYAPKGKEILIGKIGEKAKGMLFAPKSKGFLWVKSVQERVGCTLCRKARRFFGGKIGAGASKMSFVPKDKEILMSKIGANAKRMILRRKAPL